VFDWFYCQLFVKVFGGSCRGLFECLILVFFLRQVVSATSSLRLTRFFVLSKCNAPYSSIGRQSILYIFAAVVLLIPLFLYVRLRKCLALPLAFCFIILACLLKFSFASV
jgi:hypothetical protein